MPIKKKSLYDIKWTLAPVGFDSYHIVNDDPEYQHKGIVYQLHLENSAARIYFLHSSAFNNYAVEYNSFPPEALYHIYKLLTEEFYPPETAEKLAIDDNSLDIWA